MNDEIKARGEVTLTLTDHNGEVKESVVTNLVVSAGKAFIASRLKDTTFGVVSHIALGTSSTAASASDTALVAEIGRVALSSMTLVTTTVAADTVQHVATFGPGVATGAVTEAGLFNAASSGTMVARTVFGVVTKGASDTLAITWKLIIA